LLLPVVASDVAVAEEAVEDSTAVPGCISSITDVNELISSGSSVNILLAEATLGVEGSMGGRWKVLLPALCSCSYTALARGSTDSVARRSTSAQTCSSPAFAAAENALGVEGEIEAARESGVMLDGTGMVKEMPLAELGR